MKKAIAAASVFMGFVVFASFAFAQDYTPLAPLPIGPGGSEPTTWTLTTYLTGMIKLLVALGGALAVLTLVIGGTQYVAAGINPSAKGDAKERIMNAIIGLTLVLTSYLILNSINPNLVKFELNIPVVGVQLPRTTPGETPEPGILPPSQPPQPPVVPPPAVTPYTPYNLANAVEVPVQGHVNAGAAGGNLRIPANGAYILSFATGGVGEFGFFNTQYHGEALYVTISENKSDFSLALEDTFQAQQGTPAFFIRWSVGKIASHIYQQEAILKPNTKYYVNVRTANRIPGTETFIDTCPQGGCTFRIYGSTTRVPGYVPPSPGDQPEEPSPYTPPAPYVPPTPPLPPINHLNDYAIMTACVGRPVSSSQCSKTDLNGDGKISFADVTLFAQRGGSLDVNQNKTLELRDAPAAVSCFFRMSTANVQAMLPREVSSDSGWTSSCGGDGITIPPTVSCNGAKWIKASKLASKCAIDNGFMDMPFGFVYGSGSEFSRFQKWVTDASSGSAVNLTKLFESTFFVQDTSSEDGMPRLRYAETDIGKLTYATIAQYDLNGDGIADFSVGGSDMAGSADFNQDGETDDRDLSFVKFMRKDVFDSAASAMFFKWTLNWFESMMFDPKGYDDKQIIKYCIGHNVMHKCALADVNGTRQKVFTTCSAGATYSNCGINDVKVDNADLEYYNENAPTLNFNGNDIVDLDYVVKPCTPEHKDIKFTFGKDFGGNFRVEMSCGDTVSFEFHTPPMTYWRLGGNGDRTSETYAKMNTACATPGDTAANESLICQGGSHEGSLITEMDPIGTLVMKHIHISKTKSDFTYPSSWDTLDWDGCSVSDAIAVLRYKIEETDSHPWARCSLRPDTTYYINLRNEDAKTPGARGLETCPTGVTCGYLYQMH